MYLINNKIVKSAYYGYTRENKAKYDIKTDSKVFILI